MPNPLPTVGGSNGTWGTLLNTYLAALPVLVADTTATGFTLINGTPTILTWTAPNDGNLHTAFISFMIDISSATTGGEIAMEVSAFAGGRTWAGQVSVGSISPAGLYPGNNNNATTPFSVTVPAAGTVSLVQFTALTAGAAKVYAQMWAV